MIAQSAFCLVPDREEKLARERTELAESQAWVDGARNCCAAGARVQDFFLERGVADAAVAFLESRAPTRASHAPLVRGALMLLCNLCTFNPPAAARVLERVAGSPEGTGPTPAGPLAGVLSLSREEKDLRLLSVLADRLARQVEGFWTGRAAPLGARLTSALLDRAVADTLADVALPEELAHLLWGAAEEGALLATLRSVTVKGVPGPNLRHRVAVELLATITEERKGKHPARPARALAVWLVALVRSAEDAERICRGYKVTPPSPEEEQEGAGALQGDLGGSLSGYSEGEGSAGDPLGPSSPHGSSARLVRHDDHWTAEHVVREILSGGREGVLAEEARLGHHSRRLLAPILRVLGDVTAHAHDDDAEHGASGWGRSFRDQLVSLGVIESVGRILAASSALKLERYHAQKAKSEKQQAEEEQREKGNFAESRGERGDDGDHGKDGEEPSATSASRRKFQEETGLDFLSGAVRVIANLAHGYPEAQDRARAAGAVTGVLNHCGIDASNPYIREYSILAVRNLCAGNEANQAVIASLGKAQDVVNKDELTDLGIAAQVRGDDGKVVYHQHHDRK